MSVPQCCVRSMSLPASLALATPQGSRERRVRSSNSATASLRGTRRHGARSDSDHASFLLALARGPLPRSVRFVRQQIVSANPVRPRSESQRLYVVNFGPPFASYPCLTGLSNTRDKLRSSNMLGFVCFIPLLDGLVFRRTSWPSAKQSKARAPCYRLRCGSRCQW